MFLPRRLVLFCLLSLSAFAQELPVPQLKSIFPIGAARGSQVEVTVTGGGIEDTNKLYFSAPGVTAELVSDPAKPPARFKVSVAADAPIGDCDVRTIGKLGISNPRAFSIGAVPETNEKEPNNEREKANRIEMNSVVNGRIDPAEDIDWYVFAAKKGQRVLIECRASRIDSRLDGMVTLYNSEGKELATSQDENIRDQKKDPFIDFDVPEDGDYYLRFTDFMYNGSPENFYRLSVGTGPYLDYITPTGAKPGTTAEITCYGRNLPGGVKTDVMVKGRPLEKLVQKVEVPADPTTTTGMKFSELLRPPDSRIDGMEVRVSGPNGTSNARLLLFSDVPELGENEPNNAIDEAQKLPIPSAVTGAFSAPKDADLFSFSAKKDQKILIEVSSERIGSPADPDMEISEGEKLLQSVQDTGENIGNLRFPTQTRDIFYTFNAPKDGDFILRLEHVYTQVQGGPQYQYRLQIQQAPLPDFRLVCAPAHDIHLDSPVVYQGGRQRLDILVWRMNGHNDPITVEARNLPPGVTAEPITLGPNVKWGTLVITAAPDAPIGEGEIQVIGTSIRGEEKLVRAARGGALVWDTVNTAGQARLTQSIVIAVRESTPFSVTAAVAQETIKPGDPLNVTVTATRRADMPSAIQLNGNGIGLPDGLTIPVITINPGQTEAKVAIDTAKMKEGTYSFILNAEAQVPTGDKKTRVIYPSNPMRVTVTAPPAKK